MSTADQQPEQEGGWEAYGNLADGGGVKHNGVYPTHDEIANLLNKAGITPDTSDEVLAMMRHLTPEQVERGRELWGRWNQEKYPTENGLPREMALWIASVCGESDRRKDEITTTQFRIFPPLKRTFYDLEPPK